MRITLTFEIEENPETICSKFENLLDKLTVSDPITNSEQSRIVSFGNLPTLCLKSIEAINETEIKEISLDLDEYTPKGYHSNSVLHRLISIK